MVKNSNIKLGKKMLKRVPEKVKQITLKCMKKND